VKHILLGPANGRKKNFLSSRGRGYILNFNTIKVRIHELTDKIREEGAVIPLHVIKVTQNLVKMEW